MFSVTSMNFDFIRGITLLKILFRRGFLPIHALFLCGL